MSHLRFVVCVFLSIGSSSLPVLAAHSQHPWGRDQGIIFVAPASGDMRLVVSSTERAVAKAGLPYHVALVDWATGDIAEDVRNRDNHRRAGWYLAQRVLAYRQAYPECKVFLVGHSGGAAVLLAASQWLPANSVERIILLAPGVSCQHDLRRALQVSRCGIDNFFSRDDMFGSGVATVFGTNDGRGTRSAGEVGFAPIITSPMDAALYGKLRQYPWRSEYADHGYHAGHFGVAGRRFLSYAMIPLLAAS